jgi:ribosomal protein S18
MKWTEDEIVFMSVALEEGWTHKEIGNELDRTSKSVKNKSGILKLCSLNNKQKSTDVYKKELPKDIIVLEPYINRKTKILHKHLTCEYEWLIVPYSILNGNSCPKCAGNKKKTTYEYINQLPDDIIVLEPYINTHTKIKHKHLTCSFEWEVEPNSILQGRSCPKCSRCAFNNDMPAVTYCIYFPEHNIYKFGISNNYLRRFKDFGSKPEIIFIREFALGSEARELEQQWSKNVDHLKINTGLLKSGNTETFEY